jgi:hypothetical protein
VKKINNSEMPFAQRENIQSFCDAVGSRLRIASLSVSPAVASALRCATLCVFS